MTNNLVKVTRMTVYTGEYKTVRKSGFKAWAKVIMYVSPIVEDPFDGTKYVNNAISQCVTYWPNDQAVDALVEAAKAKGSKITGEGSKSDGYVLGESDIPREYKYAFTELGMQLHWDYIEFNNKRFKVDREGCKIFDKDNKPIAKDGITVCYWSGSIADNSGINLSKEYCIRRALSEWREVVIPVVSVVSDTNEEEENTGE